MEPRPIYEIAAEIRREWKNVYFGAVPYLDALMSMTSGSDAYGLDPGYSIINYFFANASTFRGARAKELKYELALHLPEPYRKSALKKYKPKGR